jgi:hypothetical protein
LDFDGTGPTAPHACTPVLRIFIVFGVQVSAIVFPSSMAMAMKSMEFSIQSFLSADWTDPLKKVQCQLQ